ncbi:hypothetical protein CAC42_4318 [Sphaceloma murrayae]|uniref:Uncharacterized protein n=1 Tax=Sphaceloma murrayae TaxID=2082308 RepID=A0A2K1QL93_9PEZI|nr:hypothetical protein CAC42_4318 [Sphaceloma murrayae]
MLYYYIFLPLFEGRPIPQLVIEHLIDNDLEPYNIVYLAAVNLEGEENINTEIAMPGYVSTHKVDKNFAQRNPAFVLTVGIVPRVAVRRIIELGADDDDDLADFV